MAAIRCSGIFIEETLPQWHGRPPRSGVAARSAHLVVQGRAAALRMPGMLVEPSGGPAHRLAANLALVLCLLLFAWLAAVELAPHLR